jgi:hypothetical protein
MASAKSLGKKTLIVLIDPTVLKDLRKVVFAKYGGLVTWDHGECHPNWAAEIEVALRAHTKKLNVEMGLAPDTPPPQNKRSFGGSS